jgi:hypothetical protein
MNQENPATPAQVNAPAATPGSTASVITPPSTTTPPADNGSEGKVTISTKEFAQLSRDAARGRSAERRASLGKNANAAGNVDANLNPDAADLINQERAKREEAERKALQYEVKDKIRGIIDKDEFKNIPASTKELILRNPGSVTDAEDPEVALLDVEDFLRETASKIDVSALNPAGGSAAKPQDAANRDTPPVVNAGAPAPGGAAEAQDPSKLHGHAKTQAIIRNGLKGLGKKPA